MKTSLCPRWDGRESKWKVWCIIGGGYVGISCLYSVVTFSSIIVGKTWVLEFIPGKGFPKKSMKEKPNWQETSDHES
jgi:hypothetical protein